MWTSHLLWLVNCGIWCCRKAGNHSLLNKTSNAVSDWCMVWAELETDKISTTPDNEICFIIYILDYWVNYDYLPFYNITKRNSYVKAQQSVRLNKPTRDWYLSHLYIEIDRNWIFSIKKIILFILRILIAFHGLFE